MGCGCGKKTAGATAPAHNSNRMTTYQVLKDQTVLSEYNNLRDARAEAVIQGGRVKVTSKQK